MHNETRGAVAKEHLQIFAEIVSALVLFLPHGAREPHRIVLIVAQIARLTKLFTY